MKAGQTILTLDISEQLFSLTTEALHLRSNATRSYQTLEDILADETDATTIADDLSLETLRDYRSAISSQGDVRISLSLSKPCVASLEDVRRLLSGLLDEELAMTDALSIVLFHFVVGQKAARILSRIGLNTADNTGVIGCCGKDRTNNVIPLR
ncbi:hypothetical protein [Sphingomonas morindae]|uniref:Uncharacterized protein n=1 Tax=Sphingomonas morindae TaxID=1541170 RepID=A0ABY4XDW7_9SPHN|nr:hypothetical protein [Sphingomonas morindae]USI75120.1 hypothetical protein LHA26_19705 [Sphingomonas morindae]